MRSKELLLADEGIQEVLSLFHSIGLSSEIYTFSCSCWFQFKLTTTSSAGNRFDFDMKPFFSELSVTIVWNLLGIEQDAAVLPCPARVIITPL